MEDICKAFALRERGQSLFILGVKTVQKAMLGNKYK